MMFIGLTTIVLSLLGTGVSAIPRHRETLEEAGEYTAMQLHDFIVDNSAVNVKKLVHSVSTGTMASVFPDDGQNAGTLLSHVLSSEQGRVWLLTCRSTICHDGGMSSVHPLPSTTPHDAFPC